ncbi:hypothetical protein [Mucilaginibacter sp. FT3.2]|uniref:hypothetical protein n=1 Tax=Mucilaginibacter sp. FT3.2 TaxID=2723090 RepID=UPI001620C2A4|nr:hypothetical protein [Mucilaginibacter sp. FT3.2]MBB6230932.1 hypothetical protein [Mucilaginibacter sp. FT3.2]
MQTIKPFTRIAALLLIIFVLQSCGAPSAPGIYKNEKISSSDQSRFHDLNDKLFNVLKTNDEAQLESIMSQDFILVSNKKRQVELVSNRFKEGTYSLLEEYYVVNRFIHGDTIKSALPDGSKYSIFCPGGVKEMYIACFIPKNIPNQYMITAVYCKFDYGWKLNQLEANAYAKNGKNAPELFKAAEASYGKGYLVNALNTGASAINCTRPSSIWKYDDETAMSEFYSKVLNQVSAKYRVPLAIKGAPVHLEIIRIFNQTTPDGDFPMIYYLTNIKLSDTTAVKKENEQIQKVIDKTIPGLDQENKYVLYSAFNEWPTGVKTVDHFDMKQKLK